MNHTTTVAPRKRGKNAWIVWSAILAVILVVICLLCVLILKRSISLGVDAVQDGFKDAYAEAREDTYQHFRDTAFNLAEEANHVSNDVAISISSVKEKSNLEVLKTSDIVYIISEPEATKSGTSSWLKVCGTGVFTVNLNAAEYLVDNNRHYALVRIPIPVLDSNNISIDSVESLFYKENKWSPANSIQSGERLAKEQLSKAQQQIQEDFRASEEYSKLAKSSAKSMVSALIKSLNSDIPDLQVDVEFY